MNNGYVNLKQQVIELIGYLRSLLYPEIFGEMGYKSTEALKSEANSVLCDTLATVFEDDTDCVAIAKKYFESIPDIKKLLEQSAMQVELQFLRLFGEQRKHRVIEPAPQELENPFTNAVADLSEHQRLRNLPQHPKRWTIHEDRTFHQSRRKQHVKSVKQVAGNRF